MVLKDFVDIIENIFDKWREIISLILLFIPGILYQIDFLGEKILSYNGLSIIPFMMLSFYYSIPFISLGIIFMYLLEGKENLNKDSFLFAGLIGVLVYFYSITKFPGIEYSGFWERYIASIVIIFIIYYIDLLVSKANKWRKKND